MKINGAQVQERAADLGAAQLPVVSTWALIDHATDIMQLVVLVISALAGIASWRYYRSKRVREDKSKQ